MGFRRLDYITVGDLLKQGSHLLHAHHEALLLIADVLSRDQAWVIAHGEYVPRLDEITKIQDAFLRRSRGEPIAFIRGWVEWYGHRLLVSKDTLIPRPFSEALIDIACDRARLQHITQAIDVGTGTGCLALTLAQSGVFETVLATDISSAALTIARQNQTSFSEGKRVTFLECDLLPTHIPSPSVIVANLPYLPNGTEAIEEGYGSTQEPSLALAGGPHGWETILRLMDDLEHRPWSGWLLLECESQAQTAISTSLPAGWSRHADLEVSDGTASIVVLERQNKNDPQYVGRQMRRE